MLLIVRCRDNQEYDVLDYAVATLDERMLSALGTMAEISKDAYAKDNTLWELYFWGTHVDFYGSSVMMWLQDNHPENARELDGEDGDGEWTILTNIEALPPGLTAERTECDQTIIRCFQKSPEHGGWCPEVAWFCYPKHVTVNVTTEGISLNELRKLFCEALSCKEG